MISRKLNRSCDVSKRDILISKLTQDSGWFDSHCHLNDIPDLAAQMDLARQQNIRMFVVPGTHQAQWHDVLALKGANILTAFGTHPWFVKNPEQELASLSEFVQENSACAIGEIGLDFYSSKSPRPAIEVQLESFTKQLLFASSAQLPVIIHTVKAHQETLITLKHSKVSSGVVHAFSGSYELAQQYIDLGFKLGIGPLLLKSNKIQQVVERCPIDTLLLETDAPHMVVDRQANQPLGDLILTAKMIADLKKISIQEVQQRTYLNALELFYRIESTSI